MLSFVTFPLDLAKVEHLAIPVSEDADIHSAPEIQELIAGAKDVDDFRGEKGQQVVLHGLLKGRIKRCFFAGLGPRNKIDAESFRSFAGRAVKEAAGAKCAALAIAVPMAKPLSMEPQVVLGALLEGAYLGNHAFNRYKQKPKTEALKEISLVLPPTAAKRYRKMLPRIEATGRGTILAREWVSTPSNDKFPALLAEAFASTAREAGLEVQVWDEKQLLAEKFNALLAVAAGSTHPPRMVEMIYTPKAPEKTIVLVGKGVTFDTGGINLKPSAGMEAMKADMSGAAVVAGAMTAVALTKPRHRIIGIMPIVENMPSGSATRPGDVVTSYAGKTVEIGNTDAEGRLILIDAIAYAIQKHQPDLLIDLATLTGACVVALGEKMAGLFTPDDALAEAVVTAGAQTFERCWRMPLPEDYKELLKSEIADISNMPSSRYGGAITAALFLSEFAGRTRWAHIDIAGPSFAKKGSEYCGPGGTGFGVRLLCELLERI